MYAQVKPGQEIDEAYFQKYLPVVRKRINQAGIRLAGELNKVFQNEKIKVTTVLLPPPPAIDLPNLNEIKLEEVKNAIGKTIITQGKVYSIRDIGSMTLVNLGAAYPNQLLTIALKGQAKPISSQLANKILTVEGEVIDYKGKPEIIVTDPSKIKF